MRSTSENQIKFISKKLVRSFFIERKLDYLFSLLSADAYYLGSGKNMQAEGRKKVEVQGQFHGTAGCGDR